MRQVELAAQLRRSKSWISGRLALTSTLPIAVQDAVRRGMLPGRAAMKFLVPMARANAEHCARLAEMLGEEGVTDREVERLYLAWRRGDDEQREGSSTSPSSSPTISRA